MLATGPVLPVRVEREREREGEIERERERKRERKRKTDREADTQKKNKGKESGTHESVAKHGAGKEGRTWNGGAFLGWWCGTAFLPPPVVTFSRGAVPLGARRLQFQIRETGGKTEENAQSQCQRDALTQPRHAAHSAASRVDRTSPLPLPCALRAGVAVSCTGGASPSEDRELDDSRRSVAAPAQKAGSSALCCASCSDGDTPPPPSSGTARRERANDNPQLKSGHPSPSSQPDMAGRVWWMEFD